MSKLSLILYTFNITDLVASLYQETPSSKLQNLNIRVCQV